MATATASRPAATGREFVSLTALLAAFVAMPWLVRPLERLLPAAEAVDPDFADALTGDALPRRWNPPESKALPARWRPDAMNPRASTGVEVVLRSAPAAAV